MSRVTLTNMPTGEAATFHCSEWLRSADPFDLELDAEAAGQEQVGGWCRSGGGPEGVGQGVPVRVSSLSVATVAGGRGEGMLRVCAVHIEDLHSWRALAVYMPALAAAITALATATSPSVTPAGGDAVHLPRRGLHF